MLKYIYILIMCANGFFYNEYPTLRITRPVLHEKLDHDDVELHLSCSSKTDHITDSKLQGSDKNDIDIATIKRAATGRGLIEGFKVWITSIRVIYGMLPNNNKTLP